jgi:hypothetical protein
VQENTPDPDTSQFFKIEEWAFKPSLPAQLFANMQSVSVEARTPPP